MGVIVIVVVVIVVVVVVVGVVVVVVVVEVLVVAATVRGRVTNNSSFGSKGEDKCIGRISAIIHITRMKNTVRRSDGMW